MQGAFLRRIFFTCFISITSSFIRAAPLYNVTIVNIPAGYSALTLGGVNQSGQVSGEASVSSGTEAAFLGTPPSGLVLPSAGFANTVAFTLNNNGMIVGWSTNSSFNFVNSFTWSSQTGYTFMGVPAGYAFAGAASINDLGQTAGDVVTSTQFFSGAVWTNGTPQVIAGTSNVSDINNSGQIIGSLSTPGLGFFGTINGSLTPIAIPGYSVIPISISQNGQIVGMASSSTNSVWILSGGSLQMLPTLPGYTSMQLQHAGANNDLGQVVGNAFGGGSSATWVWSSSLGLVNLDTVVPAGWDIISANAINDSGQIAGYGTFGGQSFAVRLDPIQQTATPEPGSLFLIAPSLAALGYLACRKAKRSRR